MALFKKANSILKRLKRDESGITAITWSLSVAVIIGTMGAAMDIATLSNAKSRSQSIADTTALAAAIYVKTNGRVPTEVGELTHGNHTAAQLGYEYKNYVVDGADGVNVNINYDDNAKEVTTTVTGKTNPILVQLLGQSELKFSTQSVVSYLNVDDKFPASIALVLDNSGSMQFDDKLAVNVEMRDVDYTCTKRRRVYAGRNRWGRPYYRYEYYTTTCTRSELQGDKAADTKIRLDGLKASVETFQDELKSRLDEDDDNGRKTLRMGMLPYSSSTISTGLYQMNWGYLPEGNKNDTNDDPRRAGIYGMRAEGGTNSSPPMTTAEDWMEAEDAVHEEEARITQTENKEPLKFIIFMTDGQNSVGAWNFTPGNTGKWYRRQYNGSYAYSPGPSYGYREGTVRRQADIDTEQACARMNAEGVKIFTIGYALEDAGYYRVNGLNGNQQDTVTYLSEDIRTAAYNLMTNCATTPDHFIKAADASQLEAAFDEIQNAIVEELIRLKS